MASKVISKDRARNNAAAYSVIAIAILIAIPAMIAYADSSDAKYNSPLDYDNYVSSIRVREGSDYLNADAVELYDNGKYSATFEFTGLTTQDDKVQIGLSTSAINLDDVSRITFSGSGEYSMVRLDARVSNSWIEIPFEYNHLLGMYVLDLSPSVELSILNASQILIAAIHEDVIENSTPYSVEIQFFEGNSIFTHDVIEMITLISGIMLIVFSLFATPWISVSKVTRTTRRAARSVSNGAKKATRSVKRSVKKR